MKPDPPQPLSDVYTVEEAAEELSVTPASIYRMITEKQLEARKASFEELALLEKQERIKVGASSGRGRNLILANSVERAKSRPAPGWPRKNHKNTPISHARKEQEEGPGTRL